MKNADKPIYPFNEIDWNRSSSEVTTYYSQESGLTKKEYYSGLALQGFCSNQEFMRNLVEPELIAKACIEIADELLKQLEEK